MKELCLRAGVLAAVAAVFAVGASSAFGQNYVVLYKSQAVPASAAQTITAAACWPRISI